MSSQDTEKNKQTFVENLENCKKNITQACRKTGINRATYYDWIEKDKDFKEKCEEANEAVDDHVVSKLHERIDGIEVWSKSGVYKVPPDITGIIFYLKTQLKNRGYVERQELTGIAGKDLGVKIYIPDNGRDEKKELPNPVPESVLGPFNLWPSKEKKNRE